jgi:hypothetical protein
MRKLATLGLAAFVAAGVFGVVLLTREDSPRPAYRVSDPGLYRVQFQKCGFDELELDDVRVRAGVMTVVSVTLEPRGERC